jgi:hypothetical protein
VGVGRRRCSIHTSLTIRNVPCCAVLVLVTRSGLVSKSCTAGGLELRAASTSYASDSESTRWLRHRTPWVRTNLLRVAAPLRVLISTKNATNRDPPVLGPQRRTGGASPVLARPSTTSRWSSRWTTRGRRVGRLAPTRRLRVFSCPVTRREDRAGSVRRVLISEPPRPLVATGPTEERAIP